MFGENNLIFSITYAVNSDKSMLEGRHDISSAREILLEIGQCQSTHANRMLYLVGKISNVHFGRNGVKLLGWYLF